jgi:hypothetical protein
VELLADINVSKQNTAYVFKPEDEGNMYLRSLYAYYKLARYYKVENTVIIIIILYFCWPPYIQTIP